MARISCVAVDDKGYETAPFSILSNGCDGNGYFFATLSPYSSLVENKKIKECKAFLDYSPLDTCKVPTDVWKFKKRVQNTFECLDPQITT